MSDGWIGMDGISPDRSISRSPSGDNKGVYFFSILVYLGLSWSIWFCVGVSGSTYITIEHCRTLNPTGGIGWIGWISPGGRRYRAHYGANNRQINKHKESWINS